MYTDKQKYLHLHYMNQNIEPSSKEAPVAGTNGRPASKETIVSSKKEIENGTNI